MKDPLVTIGITAFNAENTIERAVRSAFAQSWWPIEIVVVDDCSTDQTPAVLARLAAGHFVLHVFRNRTNGGVAASRNRILAEARGEFIAFFDDDDESLPDRVEAQLRRIVDYERDFAAGAPVICHTARRLIYPDDREQIVPTMGQREGRLAPAGFPVAERILLGMALEDGYGACPTCSQMGRLSTYHALGGFDPLYRRGEDTDLDIRLAKAGAHFVGIAKPLVAQTMTKTPDKGLDDERRSMLMLLEKHRDVPDRVGLYGFCRRWVEMKHAWQKNRWTDFALRLVSLAMTNPVLTVRRLRLSAPNIVINRAWKHFLTMTER